MTLDAGTTQVVALMVSMVSFFVIGWVFGSLVERGKPK